MKTVYILGSFMNDNFGDYLIYQETIDCIKEKFGDDIVIVSSDVSTFYDQYTKVNRMTHKRCLKKADYIVMTGGGYFGEGNRKKLLWNLYFIRYYGLKALDIALSKKSFIIVGVGAGPFKYFFSRWITRYVFNKSVFSSVRDQESKDFLKKIGVRKDVEMHADWILGMEPKKYLDSNFRLKRICANEEYLVVHIISKRTEPEQGVDLIANEINDFLSIHNQMKIVVTCDQTKSDVYERTKELSSLFDPNRTEYYEYKSPRELMSILNGARLVITDKLHVGIVSMNLGKNVVSVPLHNKTPRLYKQLNRSDYCVMMNAICKGDVKKRLDMAYNAPECNIEQYKADSLENRKFVVEYLKGALK